MFIEKEFYIGFRDLINFNKLSNTSLLSFLEDIAGYHSNSVGNGLNDIVKTKKSWVLLNWKVTLYERPIYAETVKLKTWSRKMDKIYAYRDYEIFNSNKYLSFKQDGEIIRIPYNDILFIEKDKNEECLYIETINDKIPYRGTMPKLEAILKEDRRFFKSHRSCIVNTFKIIKINPSTPAIYFENKMTNCLSRDKRKELESICMLGGRYYEL